MSTESFYYQELREMLQKPGCPVCHVGRKVARGQINSLLYDSVTDKDSREKLAESLGFCNLHSRELLSFPGERLGATIIEWAVLREAQRRLQRSAPAGAPGIRQRLRGQTAGEVLVGAGRAVPGLPATRPSWRRARCVSCWNTWWAIWMLPSRPQAACAGRIWTWQWPRPAIHACTVHLSSSTATFGRA